MHRSLSDAKMPSLRCVETRVLRRCFGTLRVSRGVCSQPNASFSSDSNACVFRLHAVSTHFSDVGAMCVFCGLKIHGLRAACVAALCLQATKSSYALTDVALGAGLGRHDVKIVQEGAETATKMVRLK